MYSDPNFTVRVSRWVVGTPEAPDTLGTVSAAAGGTDTYSAAAGTSANGVYALPKFARATKVNAVRVHVGTAAGGGVTNQKFFFWNGTNCIGTATIGASAANVVVSATMNDTNTYDAHAAVTNPCEFAAGGQLAMTVTNTNTATASTLGAYSIEIETQELFVS